MDGSEKRGALKATIDAKYGTFSGSEDFTIWMPKIPLHVELDDIKLSQIKSWYIPSEISPINIEEEELPGDQSQPSPSHYFTRKKRSKSNSIKLQKDISSLGIRSCTPRYQQTKVKVFAEFSAEDPDSGRKEFFPVRGTQLDVTELLIGRSLRISNSRIATLRGNIIQGRLPGKTEVKVYHQKFSAFMTPIII